MSEQQILELLVQGTFSVVFAILYIRLWGDYKDLQEKYLEDLRDIAGIRQQLRQMQANMQQQRNFEDTRPLPDLSDSGAD